jgi:hypothetical protein
LVVLSDTGDQLAYERRDHGNPWSRIAMTATQSARVQDALAILRSAEDLLVSGRYNANPNSL